MEKKHFFKQNIMPIFVMAIAVFTLSMWFISVFNKETPYRSEQKPYAYHYQTQIITHENGNSPREGEQADMMLLYPAEMVPLKEAGKNPEWFTLLSVIGVLTIAMLAQLAALIRNAIVEFFN